MNVVHKDPFVHPSDTCPQLFHSFTHHAILDTYLGQRKLLFYFDLPGLPGQTITFKPALLQLSENRKDFSELLFQGQDLVTRPGRDIFQKSLFVNESRSTNNVELKSHSVVLCWKVCKILSTILLNSRSKLRKILYLRLEAHSSSYVFLLYTETGLNAGSPGKAAAIPGCQARRKSIHLKARAAA